MPRAARALDARGHNVQPRPVSRAALRACVQGAQGGGGSAHEARAVGVRRRATCAGAGGAAACAPGGERRAAAHGSQWRGARGGPPVSGRRQARTRCRCIREAAGRCRPPRRARAAVVGREHGMHAAGALSRATRAGAGRAKALRRVTRRAERPAETDAPRRPATLDDPQPAARGPRPAAEGRARWTARAGHKWRRHARRLEVRRDGGAPARLAPRGVPGRGWEVRRVRRPAAQGRGVSRLRASRRR